jgi:hypothetical protein
VISPEGRQLTPYAIGPTDQVKHFLDGDCFSSSIPGPVRGVRFGPGRREARPPAAPGGGSGIRSTPRQGCYEMKRK